jgi:hypothetical protein
LANIEEQFQLKTAKENSGLLTTVLASGGWTSKVQNKRPRDILCVLDSRKEFLN